MKRTPLARKAALDRSSVLARRTALKRTPIAPAQVPASSRRRRSPDLDIPQDARDLVRARSGGRCEAPVDPHLATLVGDWTRVCTDVATDVHHRKRRRDGGHAVTNLLDLCRPCHAWTHAHPDHARRIGLIVSVYEDPADVPVTVRSRLTGGLRRALLTRSGEYAS